MNFLYKYYRIVIWIVVCVLLSGTPSLAMAKSYDAVKRPGDLATLPIMGEAIATKEQCLRYLLRVNPKPSLTVSPKALVDHYYEEGKREGIRPDIAFAQAMHETGYFRYGGLVQPGQNNYCGLGSMHSGAKGAWFKSPEVGVRAHVQHILAYTTVRLPREEIVDPRYNVVKTTNNFGKVKTWQELNGKWAVPGTNYAQKIMTIYGGILAER